MNSAAAAIGPVCIARTATRMLGRRSRHRCKVRADQHNFRCLPSAHCPLKTEFSPFTANCVVSTMNVSAIETHFHASLCSLARLGLLFKTVLVPSGNEPDDVPHEAGQGTTYRLSLSLVFGSPDAICLWSRRSYPQGAMLTTRERF